MSAGDRHARRLDRWLDIALVVLTTLACIAFLEVLLADIAELNLTKLSLLWLGALLFFGLAFGFEAVYLSRQPRGKPTPGWLDAVSALKLLPVIILVKTSLATIFLALLVLVQAHLFLRRDRDAYALGNIVLGPTMVVIGLALTPADHWLVLFPLSVLASAWAGLLLQARRAHERATERTPLGVIPPSVLREEEIQQRRGLWRLSLYALPLSLTILAAIPLLYSVVLLLPEPVLSSETARNEPEPAQIGGDLEPTDEQEVFNQIFPTSVPFERGVVGFRHQDVMRVTPLTKSGAPRDIGPLYLRGAVADTFTNTGAVFSGGNGVRDIRVDARGHSELAAPVLGDAIHRLAIVQQPAYLKAGGLGVLFAPIQLLGVDIAPVRFDPDGSLIAVDIEYQPERGPWFEFEATYHERRWGLVDVGDARALHPNPIYVQRPPSRNELKNLRDLAVSVTAGATTDRECVSRVLAYFADDFQYSLETIHLPGLRGILEFLERKHGPCTAYASTATLLLRSIDIPARIATGYVAKEFDAGVGCYSVTTREGHAWVEVHFEGIGWVTLDPTPSALRDRALAELMRLPADSGLEAWMSEIVFDLRRWATTGASSESVRDLAQTLVQGPRAAWESLRHAPWLGFGSLALALALVLACARFLRRSREKGGPLGRARPIHASDSVYRKLLRALARRGHVKQGTQTFREFTREVCRAESELLEPLGRACELVYRDRFGGRPLSTTEGQSIEALVEHLEAAPTHP